MQILVHVCTETSHCWLCVGTGCQICAANIMTKGTTAMSGFGFKGHFTAAVSRGSEPARLCDWQGPEFDFYFGKRTTPAVTLIDLTHVHVYS